MRACALVVLLTGCAAPDVALERPLEVRPALTDVNADPDIVEVTLVASEGKAQLLVGKAAATIWGYRDGAVADSVASTPGPTITGKVGDRLIVHFRNELAEPSTVHWHGLRLPPAADGSTAVQNAVNPGETFDYVFTLKDAGTFWYHPHVKGDEQIERGLYGALIVTGGPAIDTTADRTFILDDVKLAATGQLSTETDLLDIMLGRQGNVLLVNGQPNRQIAVLPRARERWRFINAANGRYFNLRLPGHTFTVIGWDGGAVPEPYVTETLLVAPGERYEVLVDFDDRAGTLLSLETIFYDRGHDQPDVGPQSLLGIEVRGASAASLPALPTSLANLERLPVSASTRVRTFVLEEREVTGANDVSFTINGERWPFSKRVMATNGEVEIWSIDNRAPMDHPFHLHGMFFQVLDVDGKPAPRQGWKDTVNVPQHSVLRFVVRYETVGMWMFHCHILEHAERGMMGDLMIMP